MKINFILLFVCFLMFSSGNFAQSNSKNEQIKRFQGETAENFVKRNGHTEAELVHKVIETDAWNGKNTIFAFYSGETAGQVDGYIFVPISADAYEKILINNFEEEGGTPKIESVFFANADKDKAKELIVICSWNVSHYDVSGTLYGTFIFDDEVKGKNTSKLSLLEAVSEKVSGGCDCTYRDGKTKGTKKYKTASQVKTGLRKIGF